MLPTHIPCFVDLGCVEVHPGNPVRRAGAQGQQQVSPRVHSRELLVTDGASFPPQNFLLWLLSGTQTLGNTRAPEFNT